MKNTVLVSALTAALCAPPAAWADERALAQIRDEIKQLKENYEARIQALENRLQEAQARAPAAQPVASSAPATAAAFNPAIALTLSGTYANLSQDPAQYRIQGFVPSGTEIGPGQRAFHLGESELTFSANVDPYFSGNLTFSLAADNTASVEVAFFETQGLSQGMHIKGGRFLSSIGYLNSQHAHAWDFVDAPLMYQALFGGQYQPEGVQARWLAPTERFFELGLEAGNGAAFPGNDRNKNGIGATALFAHMGDDLGESASWRAGVSYLRSAATNRLYDDVDHTGVVVTDGFSGRSATWIVDGIYKWAPYGNATHRNFKLQAEYFRRTETGALNFDTQAQSLGQATGDYASGQSGWYVQGVYQFMPAWRVGLRYDRLHADMPGIGLIDHGVLSAADFPRLAPHNPTRHSLMLDYTPSEFSRVRLQLARDRARADAIDNQLFLQYIMSLGAHGAHAF